MLHGIIYTITTWFPDGHIYHYHFNVYASIAIVLVSLICGSLGGLVVGNRMAFFSDALAHCAWAGVSLGLILCLLAELPDDQFREWITTIMVGFGVVVALAIAFVRDRTGLAGDTVIGVFFALAVGLGAICTRLVAAQRRLLFIESFMFGEPLRAREFDLYVLAGLLVVTVVFLAFFYNNLVLTSVHSSLALSRGVSVRLLRYALIVLLAVAINVCLQVVGTLLINGLLIVPAAAAANVCRDMRRHYWVTIGLTLVCGLGGQFLAFELSNRFAAYFPGVSFPISGTILVLTCLAFFVSMLAGRRNTA